MGCNNCQEPMGSEPWIETISVSGSASKTGYTFSSTPNMTYLTSTSVDTLSQTYQSIFGAPSDTDYSNLQREVNWSLTNSFHKNPDTGVVTGTPGGTENWSYTQTSGTTTTSCTTTEVHNSDGSVTETNSPSTCSALFTRDDGEPTTTLSGATQTTNFSCPLTPTLTSYARTIVTTLSDEYTTAMLKARVVANLPGWPNGPGGPNFAASSAHLSPDESSYSISRIKWQVAHYPQPTCYLKVWLDHVFHPEGNDTSGDVITPLAEYEWVGTGTPCLADASKASLDPANIIRGGFTQENEPATNGSNYIRVRKYSLLKDYEPDDPNTDGSRPDPDPKSNAFLAVIPPA